MNENKEFLWRRLSESFSDWAVGLPVLFAYIVLGLMVLFRKERRFAGLLIPFILVTVASAVYIPTALTFKPLFSWWVVLVPLLAIALFYVLLMYVKDAQTIHPLVAGFLGVLRCTVYAILAVVFLLPGCQTYDRSENHFKTIFLFDVSGSMQKVDGVPKVGEDRSLMKSRQKLVLDALVDRAILQSTLAKSPITAYRIGGVADDIEVKHFKEGEFPSKEDLLRWLTPDAKDLAEFKFDETKLDPKAKGDEGKRQEEREKQLKEHDRRRAIVEQLVSATNVPGSANTIAKLEANNLVQAIVIFSDGQSNTGSDDSLREFVSRVNNPKRPIQVYAVGVGEYQMPAEIVIGYMQAPETARPDDKFIIRVPVIGRGLPEETFECVLEVKRVADAFGKEVSGEQPYVLGPLQGKFKGGGDNPRDEVEFVIDVQKLKGKLSKDDKDGELEGTWTFVAKVPRNPREVFEKAEHVSDPAARVLVQKKKMRVLLFASGPSREYQFLRTLLYREVVEKRLELSVLLQTGRDTPEVEQDVEPERLLNRFPDVLGPSKEKHMSLNDYDLIVAFDPDWMQLTTDNLAKLKEWVSQHSGGVIFSAGPVNSYQLARPGSMDISALQTIYPVVLKDARLHGLGIGHDPSRPYALDFPKSVKQPEFLKLDEKGESPTAGWNTFFWGKEQAPEMGKDVRPLRGMHNYYPVDKVKPASIVMGAFEGPASSRINDGKDPQPWLVTMPYGSGKTVYLGSPETWRLRMYKENFHERFWIKLIRYAASATTSKQKYGDILISAQGTVGNIPVEAQIRGEDFLPLPKDAKPTVFVRKTKDPDGKPETFDLKARVTQVEWNGIFTGVFKAKEEGEYELSIPVPGTNETLKRRINITKTNLETDNYRHNHGALYQLATDATPVLNRLTADVRKEVERSLSRPTGGDVKEIEKDSGRLFFLLPGADAIPKCLSKMPPRTESTKGAFEDLWDEGYRPGWKIGAYQLSMLVPFLVGLLGAGILLLLRQFLVAGIFFGASLVIVLGVFILGDPNWVDLPIDFSFVLITVVTLLAAEWLTRKLLKLA